MNSALKTTLLVIGILGAVSVFIFVSILAVTFYFGDSFNKTMEDVERFSANANKTECVQEMASRLKKCDGFQCTLTAIGFGSMCTEMAKGANGKDDNITLCKSYSDGHWKAQFCEPHKLSNDDCDTVKELLYEHCER